MGSPGRFCHAVSIATWQDFHNTRMRIMDSFGKRNGGHQHGVGSQTTVE
jgi:hypothetical protein